MIDTADSVQVKLRPSERVKSRHIAPERSADADGVGTDRRAEPAASKVVDGRYPVAPDFGGLRCGPSGTRYLPWRFLSGSSCIWSTSARAARHSSAAFGPYSGVLAARPSPEPAHPALDVRCTSWSGEMIEEDDGG